MLSVNYDHAECRRFFGETFPPGERKPGDFLWGEIDGKRRRLYIVLPGDNSPDSIPVINGVYVQGEREWGWNGDEDKPTLSPSLEWKGHWHGFLRAGRLESLPPPVFIGPQP